MRLGVLRKQRLDGRHVACRAAAQRDMVAEDDHLLLRHETQVGAQPGQLGVRKAVGVLRARGVDHVVHADHVHVAAVERVVHRPHRIAEIGGVARRGVVHLVFVVVARQREDRNARRPQRTAHAREQVGFLARDVAQRHAVAGHRRSRRRAAHVDHRLAFEPRRLLGLGGLGIADADQAEAALDAREAFEREILTDLLLRGIEPHVEIGIAVVSRADLELRGHRIVDVFRRRVALHLVDAPGIGGHALEAVAYDHALDGIPRRVAHESVERTRRIDLDLPGRLRGRRPGFLFTASAGGRQQQREHQGRAAHQSFESVH